MYKLNDCGHMIASHDPHAASAEAVAAAKVAQTEMYQALLSRRSALVIEFEKKAARYKEILIKEMVSWCVL